MNLSSFVVALFCTAFALPNGAVAAESGSPRKLTPIDLSVFHDSAHHWRFIRDESRFIQVAPDQAAYSEEQVPEIVANILLFQRANGGWPKDYDMAAVLTDEQKAAVLATRDHEDASFDNGNLHSQVSYLAHAVAQTGDPAWQEACLRGFDFLLAAQYPNGGFPQRFPHAKDFHAHITFNDYVTIGILNVLRDAADDQPHFAWLDPAYRAKARDAVRRGIDCILKCQIQVEGRRTGWCQQHDEFTFEPRPGRSFELVSVCPQDTTEIVRFLMRQPAPDADLVASVEGAVRWLSDVALQGVRLEKRAAPPADFERYSASYDIVVVPDPAAPSLWARHYEIATNKPVFASRDGLKKYVFAEIERERRTGTPWFGTWPRKLIDEEYPAWLRITGAKAR